MRIYLQDHDAVCFGFESRLLPVIVLYRPVHNGGSARVKRESGRSSEAGLKVAVFGGSGFLGHYVCGELGM
jgi:hypothetical protein